MRNAIAAALFASFAGCGGSDPGGRMPDEIPSGSHAVIDDGTAWTFVYTEDPDESLPGRNRGSTRKMDCGATCVVLGYTARGLYARVKLDNGPVAWVFARHIKASPR